MLIKLPNIKLRKKKKNTRHCYNSDCRVALSIFFFIPMLGHLGALLTLEVTAPPRVNSNPSPHLNNLLFFFFNRKRESFIKEANQ